MKKVLIIDDDPGLANIFKDALQMAQYDVIVAENGTKGIEMATTSTPAAILLDYVLPDLNGVDVLKKLKEADTTKNIPVVILSNFGQEDKIKESLYDGATDFWLKYQLGPQDLIDKVNNLLNESKTA